jgi:hypothetical protein
MIVAASKGHRLAGALMLVAALAYLVPFVPRGWVPHDEGMLGQSADQVLRGKLPHVGYEDAYTGGLSWIYAALFKISGVDLLRVRWLLFALAACTTWLVYAIVRRYHGPIGAAFTAWVALAWSFPNYFAGIPSWWLLACALACLWSIVRFVETRQWRYVMTAGLAAGFAVVIKQTGAYLLVALGLSLLYGGGFTGARSRFSYLEQLARWGSAAAAIMIASTILSPRIFQAEGFYLFAPAATCAGLLLLPRIRNRSVTDWKSPLASACVAAAAAALPVVWLLLPYALRSQLGDFVNGAFVLPQKRVAYASYLMPGVGAVVASVPLVALVLASARLGFVTRLMVSRVLLWAAAVFLPIYALWDVRSYQLVWQSARAIATLLPIAICWRLASGRVQQPDQRAVLFASAAILSWVALNQFPFAAPIYFCYVTPLAVVAAIAVASSASVSAQAIAPWGALLLLFGLLSLNRGFIQGLGQLHETRVFDADLNLPRAHLKVSGYDAEMYHSLSSTILRHLHPGGQLIAGPDCPQVYFLLGLVNPSGALFDFFSSGNNADGDSATREAGEVAAWSKGEVIVINHHPDFSPLPSASVLAELRREFSRSETIGRFEVRWR